MGVKSILATGFLGFTIFLVISFAYGFVKVGEFQSKITEASSAFSSFVPVNDVLKPLEENKLPIAFGEVYVMSLTASYTSLGNAITGTASAIQTVITQLLGQAGPLAAMFGNQVQQTVTGIIDAFLPNPLFYYLFAIISGFIPGFLFLRAPGKENFKSAAFAPIIPALIMTIIVAAISILLVNPGLAQASAQAAALPVGSISLPTEVGFADFILVFIVTFVFFAIGTLAAAALRYKLAGRAGAAPAGKTTTKASQSKSKKTKKEDKKDDEDEDEDEEDEDEE